MSVVDQLKAAEGKRLVDVEVFLHRPLKGTMLVRLTFDDDYVIELTMADA